VRSEKRTMTAKKWFVTFLITAALLCGCVMLFNYATDAFGVFEHDLFDWPSYEMTLNPRTAKLSWLLKHKDDYDSYILGCSSTSSFETSSLNEAYGASFYNMIVYGADMQDVEQQAKWLLDNCEVKNLLVNVYLDNATIYGATGRNLTRLMPWQMTGEGAFGFRLKYLLCNPRYGWDKIAKSSEDTYLTQSFDVFNEATGCYNKIVRDAEPIGDLQEYLEKYPGFVNYPSRQMHTGAGAVEGTYRSLAAIRDMCAERGVHFEVIAGPVYYKYMENFPREEVEAFYTGLAEVSPYLDCVLTPFSFDPRFFYDETHFRISVGDLIAAKLGEMNGYKGTGPVFTGHDGLSFSVSGSDVFEYVTSQTVSERWERSWNLADALTPADGSVAAAAQTADVEVLMYHHIVADEEAKEGDFTLSQFEADMAELAASRCNTILPQDLIYYVEGRWDIPERAVMITFDDGYLSNYELAFPVLKKYGFKAAIFVIGCSVGHTEHYKDTSYPITPHFSWEQAKEMTDSGLISIQSHTWDMHQWPPYEDKPDEQVRETLIPLAGDSEEGYREALFADAAKMKEEFAQNLPGSELFALAYPEGQFSVLVTETLQETGYPLTFSTLPGKATLVRYLPQSLIAVKRDNAQNRQALLW